MERPDGLHSEAKLVVLPAYAAFIIENHKEEFLSVARKLLRDLDIPLLKRISTEDGDALADKSNLELLDALSRNKIADHLEKAIDRWRISQFPRVQRNHFVVDDVTGIGHARKLSFLEFLPRYTTNPKEIVDICAEIDAYILEYTSTTLHNFVGIIDDRIHEYVEHLERRTRDLQESNASLEEFAYAASHDLKEPLRKMSIFIKLLEESMAGANEKQIGMYDRILSSADRMRALIDDLLSLSVLSVEATPTRNSLKKVFDDSLQLLDHQIDESKAIIRVSDLPEALIIPTQLALLFQNLISNSLKFAREGVVPTIDITHRYLENDRTKMLEIAVTDNGIGFDNAYSEKIFAVFQRLHTKEQYEGTGIGLAICKRIAKNHRGGISATGEVGKGATFKVLIPV